MMMMMMILITIIIFVKRIFRDVLMIQPVIQSETKLIKRNASSRCIRALQEQTLKSTFHMKIQDVTTTGNGEQGTRTGNKKMQNGNKTEIWNEVTDRARVRVRLCSHFSSSRSPYWSPAPRSPFKQHPKMSRNGGSNVSTGLTMLDEETFAVTCVTTLL